MHRIQFLILLICLFCLNFFVSATAVSYDFENHLAAEDDIYTGFIADLDTSNSLASKFETTLSESLAEGANFAGKYRLTTIDCGAQCQVNVIVDVTSGKVVDSMVSGSGVEFTADSRLVQINPGSEFEYYLVWNEDKQRFYRAYATEVTLDDGRSCFWLGTDTNGTTIHLDGSNNIYGCDPLSNVAAGTQASILKGTLYHDGGKPLGKFNADYMELVLKGATADIAQEKQVNIDIKQIKTQTGSCLKLDPIELEPTIIIYYLCDEGDDTHIVVLSNGFSQIGDALITEMIRLERNGDELIVSERLPVYFGLSAAAVDGVSESEKVSEVKPEETDTEVVATDATDEVVTADSINEAAVISPQPIQEDVSTEETEVADTSSESSEVADDTAETVQETTTQETTETSEESESTSEVEVAADSEVGTIEETSTEENTSETEATNTADLDTSSEIEANTETTEEANTIEEVIENVEVVETTTPDDVQEIVEEIDAAIESSTTATQENTTSEVTTSESNATTLSETAVADVETSTEITEESALALPDEATNPQTIGTVDNNMLAPILYLADPSQETIDSLTGDTTNPTSIGVVSTLESTPETVETATETTEATGVVDSEVTNTEASETETLAVATTNIDEVTTTDSSSPETTSVTTSTETPPTAPEETQVTEAVQTEETQTEEAQTEETQTTVLETEVPAEASETTEVEISEDNWQSHPDVVSTRMMYSELNEFIEVDLLRQKSQSFERCSPYQESERKLWSDKGTIRRYVANYSGEQNSAQVEHTYDDSGMLRFVQISETVNNSATTAENETVLEHKIYYTQEGNLLWHDKRFSNQESADSEENKVLETITFNPELAFNATHECD